MCVSIWLSGCDIARKKNNISRNGAVDEAEVVGAIDKPEVPSDNEEDIWQDKKDSLQQMLSYPVCAPKRESDDDSEEETGHHSTGPREEGAVTVSEHAFDEKLKEIRGISISENDRNKIRATFEALNTQKRGERLTKGQCGLIAWFDNLDPNSLKEGELKKKKPAPTVEQLIKRKQEAADKKRKEIFNAKVKKDKEEMKKAEAEKREEDKLAKLKLKQEQEEAKEKEKQEKNEAKMKLGNDVLNKHLRKLVRQESQPVSLPVPKRFKVDSRVQNADFSLKIRLKKSFP